MILVPEPLRFVQINTCLTLHSVKMGKRAPFRVFQGVVEPVTTKSCHLIWAVYFGEHATNGASMMQGGAISSIFDVGTANIGTVLFPDEPGSFGTTKSIEVSFLAPGPLQKAIRVDIWLTDIAEIEAGRASAEAEMRADGAGGVDISDLQTKPLARCSCVLVDLARRQKWRAANPRGRL